MFLQHVPMSEHHCLQCPHIITRKATIMGPVPLAYLYYTNLVFSWPLVFFLTSGASAHTVLGLTERYGEAKSQHGAGLFTLILCHHCTVEIYI